MFIGIDTRGAKLYAGTGIGTYTHELMKNIMKLDQKNHYLFFWPGDGYEQFKDKDNISVQLVGSKNKNYWTYDYIPNQFKERKVDLLHIPQNGIGLPSKKFCRYVITLHDLIPYILPDTVGEGYKTRFTSEMPTIIENADKIITVSQYSKEDIMKYFGVADEKIVVTHLATDEIYRPINQKQAKHFIETSYGIDKPYILYLGGFSPRKNVTGVIQAYHQSYNSFSIPHDLVIVGSPKEAHEEIVDLVERLDLGDRVKFTGFAPYGHLPYFYNAASIFVYPSIYEGFGLPPLEAMACGCPTITSNVTSIPEVVGDGAVLVNPMDIKALSREMIHVLEDKKFAMDLILKGLKRSSRFSWQKTAMDTLKVYESLL